MLLDTDVLVDILRGFPPAVSWLANQGVQPIALPGLVAMEVLQGCRNQQEQTKIEAFLRQYPLLWPTAVDCENAYRDFAAYRLSHSVGIMDSLIAHTAIGSQDTLATFNIKHFKAFPNLNTLQPY
jgi:predicted nucleic acid-binding protein